MNDFALVFLAYIANELINDRDDDDDIYEDDPWWYILHFLSNLFIYLSMPFNKKKKIFN